MKFMAPITLLLSAMLLSGRGLYEISVLYGSAPLDSRALQFHVMARIWKMCLGLRVRDGHGERERDVEKWVQVISFCFLRLFAVIPASARLFLPSI